MKCRLFILMTVLVQLTSCTKDNTSSDAASLSIINTVVGSRPLVTNFSGTDSIGYSTARQLPYGSYYPISNQYGGNQFYFPGGLVKVGLFQYPDTTAHNTPLFNLTLNLPVNSINTLFLTGRVGAPDTLFTRDVLPLHTDSSVGVRFVNLSSGSNPVNVSLSTSAGINEAGSLGYKGITAFKNYSATAAVSSYTFQFTDAVTSTVLTTFTMNGVNNGTGADNSPNQYRWRNVTIALIGAPGGTGADAQQALLINN